MIVRDGVKPLVFREDANTVSVQYSNRGEPYREGVELTFADDSWNKPHVAVLLEDDEVVKLRDKLNAYLGQLPVQPPEDAHAPQPEVFGQYDHLESASPVFSWISLATVCRVAARANYGAVRMVTELVRALEARDSEDSRPPSTLAARLRAVIEGGAF